MKLCIFQSCRVVYLNFVDKQLDGPLQSLRLFNFSDLLVASPVVSMLIPYINMLAQIVGAPLDLLHFFVGACLGLLALGAPPHHSRGRHWPLPKVGSPLWCSGFNGLLLNLSR